MPPTVNTRTLGNYLASLQASASPATTLVTQDLQVLSTAFFLTGADISKAGQTGQYADLIGAPDIGTPIQSLRPGVKISIDASDPENPIINFAGTSEAQVTAPDDFTATGDADATKFLRGDNTWAVPSGGGTVDEVAAGEGLDVDSSDPASPVVSIQSGYLAQVATTGAYADLNGLPTLFSGAYADLTGKPTLFSGAYADLSGKPALFSGAYADLSGKPTLGTAAAQASTAFATAAQGTKADSALQPAAIGASVQAFDTDTAKTDVAQTFTAPQRVSFTTLTYGATVTPNLANNNAFVLTMTGNPVIANPTNISAAIGQEALFVFRGAYQPSFGSYFKFPGGTVPTFSGSLNAIGGTVISATEILVHGAAGYA